MKRFLGLLGIVALMIVAGAADYYTREASRPYIVGTNPGGSLLQFMLDYEELRRSGRQVVIDGMCISACTLVVGLIPAERICVTPFAQLAFHSAYIPTSRGPQHSSEGTRLAWQIYPEYIRELLRERGWNGGHAKTNEHPNLLYLDANDLRPLYRNC